MEFKNEHKAKVDSLSVESAMKKMSELSKAITEDGIAISISDLYNISTGRKTLVSLYEAEALSRCEKNKSPKYVLDDELTRAQTRAKGYQMQVTDLRSCYTLAKLDSSKFSTDKENNVSYIGDLSKECLQLNTRQLSKKQIGLHDCIIQFQKSLAAFNSQLTEIGRNELVINIPFVDGSGEPDLLQLCAVDYDAIQRQKDTNKKLQDEQQQARAQHKVNLAQWLSHLDSDEREPLIFKYLSADPYGTKWDKSFYDKMHPVKVNV